MKRAVALGLLGLAGLGVPVIAASATPTREGSERFVSVPASFRAQCHSTAKAVGYAVPCPTRVPRGFDRDNDGATPGCVKTIICPGTGPWRKWAVGNSSNATQHLVITGAPTRVTSDAHVVNGPGWSGHERVRPLRWLTINGRRMHAVFVSPETNDSAFVHHVALIWTVGQHTYALGFHVFNGIERALALDVELAGSVRLVGP